jgi:hypothetical protein
MAVPAMTQRNAGSANAGEEAGADAEAGAARPKGMILNVKGPVCLLWTQRKGCGGGGTLTQIVC